MNISWINFDKHNARTGDAIIPQIQPVNNRPLCILYNAGNNDPFRNIALETAGFKFSKQGVWICPIDVMDLSALQAAFPLMEYEGVTEPIAKTVESPKDSPNSFLSIMFRNSYESEYAPDIMVNRYDGNLPPAGENLIEWLITTGRHISENTYEIEYAEGTNATLSFNQQNREVSVLFHSPEFHSEIQEVFSNEQAEINTEIGLPFTFQSKVFYQLSDNSFAPAVMRANGPLALTSFACPSPHEVLRRIDLETLATVMTDTELEEYEASLNPPVVIERKPEKLQETPVTEGFDPLATAKTMIQVAADSVEELLPDDVERVIENAFHAGDDQLMAVYDHIKENREDLKPQLTEAFDIAAGFLTQSSNEALAKLADEHMEGLANEAELDQLLDSIAGTISGKELKHESSERWGFISPDIDDLEKYRFTTFDSNGFISHSTFNSEEEAFQAAVTQYKFNEWDLGALKRHETTAKFLDGMIATANAQAELSAGPTEAPEEVIEINFPFSPEENSLRINTTFQARDYLVDHKLDDSFRVESDGKLSAIYFRDYPEALTYIEGSPTRSNAIKGLNFLCTEGTKEVGHVLEEQLIPKLNIDNHHSATIDIKKDAHFVETNGSNRISVHIEPLNNEIPEHKKISAEFRIFMDKEQPTATVFMRSGKNQNFESLDLMAKEERELTFPQAPSFESLSEQIAQTFNTVSEKVWSLPDALMEAKTVVEAPVSHSARFNHLKSIVDTTPFTSFTAAFREQVKGDDQLEDGEHETLIELIDQIQNALPPIESVDIALNLIAMSTTEAETLAIWKFIKDAQATQQTYLSEDEEKEIYAEVFGPDTVENIAENSSHWSKEFVSAQTALKIDALEESARSQNQTIAWYSIYRESSGKQLIARIDQAKYDVVLNDEGSIQQAPSLLNLYIKTKRADLLRTSSLKLESKLSNEPQTSLTQEQPIHAAPVPNKQTPRIADDKGEYGLDDNWYSPGQEMPESATSPELARPVADVPNDQQSIYAKIRKFVQPIEGDNNELIGRKDIPDSELMNYFNSMEQFNALLDRYNEGKRFYSPEWLMLNYTAIPEVTASLPKSPIGSEAVVPSTQINYTAIVRDTNNTPYMVLTKRHGKMQIAEIKDGKPVVHSDCPVVECDGSTYYFNNEWFEDGIVEKTENIDNSENEPSQEQATFYHNEGLSNLLVQAEIWISGGKGKHLDTVAKALNLAKRKKEEVNASRSERFSTVIETIKQVALIPQDDFAESNKLQKIKEVLQTLELSTSGKKKTLVDKLYGHFSHLGSQFEGLKAKQSLLKDMAGQIDRGEFVSLDMIAAAKGQNALNHVMVYTQGDVQIAQSLNETHVRPKGQRNNNEHYYEAMEALITQPLETIRSKGVFDSEAMQAYIAKLRSITNKEISANLTESYLKPLLKDFGIPENTNLTMFLMALEEDLESDPSIDMSFQALEEVIPEYEVPYLTEDKNYHLPTSFAEANARWKHLKTGETDTFAHEENLIALIKEARDNGVSGFVEATQYIQNKYPDFFPEDIDIGTPAGAIQTEVTLAWQYVRDALAKNIETAQIQKELNDEVEPAEATANKTADVLELHQPTKALAQDNFDLETEVPDVFETLQKADISFEEISSYIRQVAEVDKAIEDSGNITSFNLIKAKRDLDKLFNELSEKAYKTGLVLNQSNLLDIANQIKEAMQNASSNEDTPWLMDEEIIQSFPDELFIKAATEISDDRRIEKALLTAKRMADSAKVRLLENSLSDETSNAELVDSLNNELDTFIKVHEYTVQIEALTSGATSDTLSTFQYDQLTTLRAERAELQHNVSSIEITDDLEEIYKNSGSYTETAESIAQSLNIDYYAAELLGDRISEQLNTKRKDAAKKSPEFIFGMEVLEHATGYERKDPQNIESIGSIIVGPYNLYLDVPSIRENTYQIGAYLSSIDRSGGSDSVLFEIAKDHPTPAEALAALVNEYTASKSTVVDTSNLPEYGSKLHSGENGSKIYDLKEINKRIRADFKEMQKQGILPKSLKTSVSKSHGSIAIRIKSLPQSIPMINPEYAAWVHENPDGYHVDAPHRFTDEYRALILALESVADAYNYDNSDRQTDYFNVNFYLNCEADHELKTAEMNHALEDHKAALNTVDEEITTEPETPEDTPEVIVNQKKNHKRIYALPHEAELTTANEELLSLGQDVRDYEGKPTGWKAAEISKDDLGLSAGGGTLLIQPISHEVVAFVAGDRPSNEAYIRAATYAIDHPITDEPKTKNGIVHLVDPDNQIGKAEQNVTTLLKQIGYDSIDFKEESALYLTIENDPYMDLIVETHYSEDSAANRTLYLTHYYRQNGDQVMDSEMVFEIELGGTIHLKETAVQNPITGGEMRGKDKDFAQLFSQNLLDQGFGDAPVNDHNLKNKTEQTNEKHSEVESHVTVEAEPTNSEAEFDWLGSPLTEFKEKLESIYGTDDASQNRYTMLLAYRFGFGPALDRAEAIDLRYSDGTWTQADRVMFKNLQNAFKKQLDTALEEELKNGNNESTSENSNPAMDSGTNDTGTDTEARTEGTAQRISGDKQRNDREENRNVKPEISRAEPSSTHGEVRRDSSVSSEPAVVPGRDDGTTDSQYLKLTTKHELDFDPRSTISEQDNNEGTDAATALRLAIEAYLRCKSEDRKPTLEEKHLFSSFGGTASPSITKAFTDVISNHGGDRQLHSTLKELYKAEPEHYRSLKSSCVDAYYTPAPLVDFMWNAADRLGLNNAEHRLQITEPSIGNGRFIGLAPIEIREGANITGIELDAFSADITSMSYPEVNVINSGFEDLVLETNSQDLVIGNPPYGDFTVYDAQDKRQRLIHDFFLKRSIELTKPGGFVTFVTSAGSLDKANSALRHQIGATADLISAFRLPRSTFNSVGAEVVTDVLFFQKRHPNQEPSNMNWLETATIEIEDSSEESGFTEARINQFYIDNPDHVLGELELTSGRFGKKLVVTGELDQSTLNNALTKLPKNIFSTEQSSSLNANGKIPFNTDPEFASAKMGSYIETSDGIFIVTGEGLAPHTAKGKRADKVAHAILIRDTALLLLDTQRAGTDAEISKLRNTLNNQYDQFNESYGSLNSKSNKNLLSLDPDQYLVLALEVQNAETGEYEKSDIFTSAFQALNDREVDILSVSDAALFLMNTEGQIDLSKIADLLEIDEHTVLDDLKEICFKNPSSGSWELNALYLSGNIYEKLDIAEKALKFNPEYSSNIEALKEALPTQVVIDEINIRMGAAWIPQKHIKDFIFEQLEANAYEERFELNFIPETHSWDFRMKQSARNEYAQLNEDRLTSPGLRYDQLITLTLNQKRAKVKDNNGNLDAEKTALAKVKQHEIIQSFKNFILNDPARSEEIQTSYNRSFNGFREASYDGSYMSFPGMSNKINGKPLKLREHQPAVIERILHTDSGCVLAHEAGAGKTIEQIAAAMEMKRLGQANKPLLVIPNHMLNQATREARDLYPNARILTATKQDFSSAGRSLFANKVKLNDWDLVICTHSMFSMMSAPAAFSISHIDNEIDEYEIALQAQADGNKVATRELEKGKKKLQSRLKATIKRIEENQDAICFGECGFDALLYDEGHYLKNYAPPTSLSDVAGVNTNTSMRAQDAVIKADYIRFKRGDNKGVYLATGTPITNSVSEVWVMMRIAAPHVLKETGLYNFDNFAATFCEVVEQIELKPEGGSYQLKARLSRFHNVPELIRIFRMVADIKTARDLNLPTPEANDIKHTAPQSSEMKMFMDWLTHRAVQIRDKRVEPHEDNILKIANDGRMASLDMRLIHEDLPDDPSSKLNECVETVYQKYIEHSEDKRTQIVFCDRGTPKAEFNLYDDMKTKWIAKGIPADQIAFIHEANNDEQKEALFSRVRSGEVRILLGSTDKMGVGTNVQTRGSDLHMLDIPWRPTDLTQRRKRFERQGNLFDDVNIHFYTTEDSFDLFMLETVVRKLKFINQAMSSPESAARTLNEESDPTLSEIMAITTGNPIIREKVEIDSKLEQLQLLSNGHKSQCRKAKSEARWIEQHSIPNLQGLIASKKEALETIPSEFEIEVKGKIYTSPKEAGIAIHKVLKSQLGAGNEVAKVAGYALISRTENDRFTLEWAGPANVSVNLTKDPARFTTNIFKQFSFFEHDIQHYEDRYQKLLNDKAAFEERANIPFAQDEELSELLQRKTEVDIEVEKLDAGNTTTIDAGFVHEFEELLSELEAKNQLLSDEEIEMYAQALDPNSSNSIAPRI